MAATIGGFAAVRLTVTYWIRPHLASPVHESLPLSAGSGANFGFDAANSISLNPPQVNVPNGWIYSTAVVDRAGHAPSSQYVAHACPVLGRFSQQLAASNGSPPSSGPGPAQFHTCVERLSSIFHAVVSYQPASRFWPFQWAEMGIFLAAGTVLCGFTYWWLGRQNA
jgi:hypothetical protein